MAVETVKFEFGKDYSGVLKVANGEVNIGPKAMAPYNLLFGALGACLYYTFIDIVNKKRLVFSGADLEISGTKRTEVPGTLETVNIKIIIKDADNEKQFLRSVELAEKYCSVHETVAKVATITTEIEFK